MPSPSSEKVPEGRMRLFLRLAAALRLCIIHSRPHHRLRAELLQAWRSQREQAFTLIYVLYSLDLEKSILFLFFIGEHE